MTQLQMLDKRNAFSFCEQFPKQKWCSTTFHRFSTFFNKKVCISFLDSFKYVITSNNCLLHSLITSDLSVFAGPRFLSVSLTTWTLLFFRNQFVKCPFFISTQIGTNVSLTRFSTMSLIPSLSCQQNSSISFEDSFATK